MSSAKGPSMSMVSKMIIDKKLSLESETMGNLQEYTTVVLSLIPSPLLPYVLHGK